MVTPRQDKSSTKTMPDILRAGSSWIKDCKGLNMDVNQINDLVCQLYTKKSVVVSGCNSGHFSGMVDQVTDSIEEDATTDIQYISGGKNIMICYV